MSQERHARKTAFKQDACSQLFEEEDGHDMSVDDENGVVVAPAPSKYIYVDVPHVDTSGRWICFDVETTYVPVIRCHFRFMLVTAKISGFAKYDNIIEIGAVELINGRRTGALFQSYINPKVLNTSFLMPHSLRPSLTLY
jgi:DNA polymerase III epsilon subunit-like protein